MSFYFFEGPAGTGKTHSLVGLASELVQGGALGDGQKLLALTFMNGARRRLEARLGADPAFRRRFECQTFDVFARTLGTRRRSLIPPELSAQTAALNEFDGPCFLAASLLELSFVREWVARSFPLVLVDEAQDLDDHRLRILQGLAQVCRSVAAADAFQCLRDGHNIAPLIGWLEGAGHTHRLSQVRRTNQRGLLAAAQAVREGRDIRAVLTANSFNGRTTWSGPGFRLLEAHATTGNHSLLAWSIANEMAQHDGTFAILTPDASNTILRATIETVRTRLWTRKNGAAFGPFPLTWDRHESEEIDALLAEVALPETATCAELGSILRPLASRVAVAQTIGRLDRLRRVCGQGEFSAAQVSQFIREAARNQARLGIRQRGGHLAMTIQRAKNREFANVIVLWPHSATGSAEHLCRLLYNAITRAQRHCSVIVLGRDRLAAPPFSFSASAESASV